MKQIEDQFDSEWVLIVDPKTDEQFNVLKGRVRCHSRDKDKVYDAWHRMGPIKESAFLYIGEFPTDTQFLL